MKARWGAVALLAVAVAAGACRSGTSCGSGLSEYTAPNGVHGCWEYTDGFVGFVMGTPVAQCPTANQLGACVLSGDKSGACGVIYYGDNGLTPDQARTTCTDAGGAWSP